MTILTQDVIGNDYQYADLEKWRSDTGPTASEMLEAYMADLRRNGPYIWVTWLTKLLVGENSCEWASWFKAQHESSSWEKVPSTFDMVGWQLNHTARINEVRSQLESDGLAVFTENQNSFTLRGNTASLGGKPDLIARSGNKGVILDIKTGQPSPSHGVQVMVYMWAVPRARGEYRGISFDGKVVYNDHEVVIPASAIDAQFTENLGSLMRRLSTKSPARKVASLMECRFCQITHTDCPEKVADDVAPEGTAGDLF